jgi:hypothetical protein
VHGAAAARAHQRKDFVDSGEQQRPALAVWQPAELPFRRRRARCPSDSTYAIRSR